jgi:hypothetical protein
VTLVMIITITTAMTFSTILVHLHALLPVELSTP